MAEHSRESTEDLAAFADQLRVAHGADLDLGAVDPSGTPGYDGDKAAAKHELRVLRRELFAFQSRLWAERKHSLLLVLQALDAGGKDGTIRKVFSAFNLQGARVAAFGVPTEEELAHDFLWRIHPHAPGHGRVAIFNRSHYEDVLVVRVAKLAPDAVWQPRYEHIRAFERGLVDGGTTVVKLYLHISKDEQAVRMRERVEDPSKQWKFRLADLDERKRWDDYQAAYEEAIAETSTEGAPWYVIPANRNWYRNWAVSTILLDTFAAIDPKYPPPEEDLSNVVIE
jgi:PPK2 family polyphosphate:nucleotide phosphotransferase